MGCYWRPSLLAGDTFMVNPTTKKYSIIVNMKVGALNLD
jgi:hypothetical protein